MKGGSRIAHTQHSALNYFSQGNPKWRDDNLRWDVSKVLNKPFWVDNQTGEVLPAKEKTKPKGVKTLKKESTMVRFKNFEVSEEADPTDTGDVVGTGSDVADWKKKKKKSSVVTRHYIEINGKRKKQTK